jgi:hypothetical protein
VVWNVETIRACPLRKQARQARLKVGVGVASCAPWSLTTTFNCVQSALVKKLICKGCVSDLTLRPLQCIYHTSTAEDVDCAHCGQSTGTPIAHDMLQRWNAVLCALDTFRCPRILSRRGMPRVAIGILSQRRHPKYHRFCASSFPHYYIVDVQAL